MFALLRQGKKLRKDLMKISWKVSVLMKKKFELAQDYKSILNRQTPETHMPIFSKFSIQIRIVTQILIQTRIIQFLFKGLKKTSQKSAKW